LLLLAELLRSRPDRYGHALDMWFEWFEHIGPLVEARGKRRT